MYGISCKPPPSLPNHVLPPYMQRLAPRMLKMAYAAGLVTRKGLFEPLKAYAVHLEKFEIAFSPSFVQARRLPAGPLCAS